MNRQQGIATTELIATMNDAAWGPTVIVLPPLWSSLVSSITRVNLKHLPSESN